MFFHEYPTLVWRLDVAMEVVLTEAIEPKPGTELGRFTHVFFGTTTTVRADNAITNVRVNPKNQNAILISS